MRILKLTEKQFDVLYDTFRAVFDQVEYDKECDWYGCDDRVIYSCSSKEYSVLEEIDKKLNKTRTISPQGITQAIIGNENTGNVMIAGQLITNNKKVNYKGWQIKYNKETELYDLYTPDEMEQPAGFREVDIELSTIEEAKAFIDNY